MLRATDMAFPPTVPCLRLLLAAVSPEGVTCAGELPLLQHSQLCLSASCDDVAAAAVCYGLIVGWWGLLVSISVILKFKVHLCVQRWRHIHGLSLCRTGLLFRIQTLFISRRVKIWPRGQMPPTYMCYLSCHCQRGICVKLNC